MPRNACRSSAVTGAPLAVRRSRLSATQRYWREKRRTCVRQLATLRDDRASRPRTSRNRPGRDAPAQHALDRFRITAPDGRRRSTFDDRRGIRSTFDDPRGIRFCGKRLSVEGVALPSDWRPLPWTHGFGRLNRSPRRSSARASGAIASCPGCKRGAIAPLDRLLSARSSRRQRLAKRGSNELRSGGSGRPVALGGCGAADQSSPAARIALTVGGTTAVSCARSDTASRVFSPSPVL
jgi:hypothetical protein